MNLTILVIEDNEQNLYLTTFLLEKNGFRIVQSRNGTDGIEAAVRERPALIVLDINLPGADGYAVARALRGTRETANIPIVAVTSYAMPGDRERILAAGYTGYIEKPIDPGSFVAQVRSYLASADLRREHREEEGRG